MHEEIEGLRRQIAVLTDKLSEATEEVKQTRMECASVVAHDEQSSEEEASRDGKARTNK